MTTTMRTSLAQIRASTYGAADDLSIILIMPSALANVATNANNRNNRWLEKIRGIYLQAARDYECALYDPYAESRWADGQDGKSLDSFAVHPKPNYNYDIWGRAVREVMQAHGLTKRNAFMSRGITEGAAPASTAALTDFRRGVTWLRAASADGYPFGGVMIVERHTDTTGRQTLIDFTNDHPRQITRHWRTSSGVWSPWSGSPGITALSLQNSWVAFGGTFGVPSVQRTPDGFVALSGVMKNGITTSNTLLATLPVGYRPAADIIVNAVKCVPGSQETTAVRIGTGGQITNVRNADASYLGFDGISFMATV